MTYWRDEFFEHSSPRAVKGGIKAQTQRGAFGQSWWAKRWIETLESFDIGARLSRGRSYARRGQVLSIEIEKGLTKAKVQGSRPSPYKVQIDVKTLGDADWEKVVQALSERAIFAAKLLAGEMPENIEEAFQDIGLSLFPGAGRDLKTDCSCPDWSNPCKHVAAVYYLLGEEFDRDPFLIFKLRGIEREELISRVGKQLSESDKVAGSDSALLPITELEGATSASEALDAEPGAFWERPGTERGTDEEVHVPPVAAALPRRLGNFPFWRGSEGFLPAMEEIYRMASPAGLDAYLGEYRVER